MGFRSHLRRLRDACHSSSASLAPTATGHLRNTVDTDFLEFYSYTPTQRRKIKTQGMARVLSVNYCRERIDNAMTRFFKSAGSADPTECFRATSRGINHDFVIVVFSLEEMDDENFYLEGETKPTLLGIVAHKGGDAPDDPAGISIKLLEPGKVFKENVVVNSKCDVRIELAALLATLEDFPLDYNLLTSNCWDYAFHATTKVLNSLIEEGICDSGGKNKLRKEKENLEARLDKAMTDSLVASKRKEI